MNLIRLLLPYLLTLFFLVRANKQPLFLLGIPFLIFMSNSIFFEDAKIFTTPGSVRDHLAFLWLIFLWAFAKIISKRKVVKGFGNNNLNILDIGVFLLAMLSIAGLFTVISENSHNTTGILNDFFLEISLFVSYFIIKNWISDNKPKLIIDFLYYLVIVNTLAGLLYILHQGLHFNIYVVDEYITKSVGDKEITRSFYFMPQFLTFSVAFLLVFRKKYSWIGLSLLAVNLMAILITYNVSTIITTLFITVLYYILLAIKKNKVAIVFKQLGLFTLVGITGFFILSKLLPSNMDYLVSRFSSLSESNYTQKDPNTLEIRFSNSAAILKKIDKYKKVFGMGPVADRRADNMEELHLATSDMVWIGVIYRWGFAGLLLIAMIYLFSLFQTLHIFKKSANDLSHLGLLFFLFLITQILEGFVSWTFLSGHGLTTGFWYFAIISALIGFYKVDTISRKKAFILD